MPRNEIAPRLAVEAACPLYCSLSGKKCNVGLSGRSLNVPTVLRCSLQRKTMMISNLQSARALIQADLDHARKVLELWTQQVNDLERALEQINTVGESRHAL